MKKISILYIGKDKEILTTVLRVINKNEQWIGTGFQTVLEAEKALKNNKFDLILLGNGLVLEEENFLKNLAQNTAPKIPIVQHYGGGSGLLQSEIFTALNS